MTPATPGPRSRRPALLSREPWSRRIARARQARTRTFTDHGLAWRLLVPAVFVTAGTLFVTSAVSSDGTELRAGRYGDLETVVKQQKKETDALRAEAAALASEVEALAADLGEPAAREAQSRVDQLRAPAGLEAVSGPGVTISLDDAPEDVIDSGVIEAGRLVVHQQDIQAVANALWAGGAEAMTLQGQRVVSTTGIKCVGNTVLLHGVPYAPPYVLTAIGDPVELLASINTNPYTVNYQLYAERYQLGWSLRTEDRVRLPAYEGSLDLDFARPAGNTASGPADSEI